VQQVPDSGQLAHENRKARMISGALGINAAVSSFLKAGADPPSNKKVYVLQTSVAMPRLSQANSARKSATFDTTGGGTPGPRGGGRWSSLRPAARILDRSTGKKDRKTRLVTAGCRYRQRLRIVVTSPTWVHLFLARVGQQRRSASASSALTTRVMPTPPMNVS